ncbi:MAG: PEP-CTERM sorting domain-containing protein [Opitutaceae bacterium]
MKILSAAILEIDRSDGAGVVNWTSGQLRLDTNSVIKNSGEFNDSASSLMNTASGGVGTFTNESTRVYNKTASRSTEIDVTFDNHGLVNIDAGTLIIDGGGTNSPTGTFAAVSGAEVIFHSTYGVTDAAKLTGAGQYSLQSDILVLDGTLSASNFHVEGGTLKGTHTITNGATWTDGNFSSGTTTNASGSVLNLSNSLSNQVDDHDIINQSGGTVYWTSGNIDARTGSVITNQGTFKDTADKLFVTNSGAVGSFQNDASGTNNKNGSGTTEFDETFNNDGEFSITTDGTFSSSADDFTLVNNGTIKKTGSIGTTTIDVPFTNNGLVTALTGNFHFTDTLTFGDGGKLGGGVQFDAPLTLPTNSTLQGNGTITGTIITGGKVSPGNSIGTLTITGDLNLLSSSSTFIEVDASTTAGSADLVNVSGNLTLGGNLSWNLLSTLDPVTTSMFTLFTANNLSGSFANATHGTRLSTADGHRSFIVNYGSGSTFDANSVIFSSFEFTPVPEPSTWALMFTGLMIITWQSRRRRG